MLAVRAYHGTPDWWDLHPPLPPPFQLPGVAPPVLASRSIPPNPTTQGLRCARCEKTSLLKQKVPVGGGSTREGDPSDEQLQRGIVGLQGAKSFHGAFTVV